MRLLFMMKKRAHDAPGVHHISRMPAAMVYHEDASLDIPNTHAAGSDDTACTSRSAAGAVNRSSAAVARGTSPMRNLPRRNSSDRGALFK
jgi:hypothetical protein